MEVTVPGCYTWTFPAESVADGASYTIRCDVREFLDGALTDEAKGEPMDKAVQDKANAILKEEAALALLPYPLMHSETTVDNDGDASREMYAICPKCGYPMYNPTYRAESDASPECLKWGCRCTYAMLTKTADAE